MRATKRLLNGGSTAFVRAPDFAAVGDSLAGNLERSARPAAIIIGAGLMGRHHAQAAAAAGARVAAIVDPDRRAAMSLASSWPGAVAETDLDRALQSTRPDVAHICTPLPTHVAVATSVADANLHALIEKPTASTAEETRRIHESFARSGKLACPTHQYAFQRSVSDVVAWLARAGALRRITFDICSAGATNGLDADAVVADILPHPLSMVQKLLPSAEIASLDWSCVRAAPGEWVITAPIESAVIVMQLSMSGRPTRFMTRVAADGGTMELDNFHDFAVTWPATVSRGAKIVQPFLRSGLGLATAGWNLAARAARREFAYPGLQALVSEFYRAVDNPATVPPPITPEQSIAVAEARDRIVAMAAYD
jgi:predicted dehydrogenase